MDRRLIRAFAAALLALTIAGCGGSPSASSPSPAPPPAQAFTTAVATSTRRIDISVSDASTALTQYQAGQVSAGLFQQRIQADYGQIAITDQAFVAELSTIRFPTAMRADVATLVAAVGRHRDACNAVTTAALADLGAAITAAANANGDVSAGVELVRSDLAPAGTATPVAVPSPSPS